MPSTILSDNGVSSGTAGIKTTGSNDGQLALQTTTSGGAATTALTIDTSQNSTFAGTASATKLIPTGGTATGNGMYLPAANAVAITTNGTQAVYIDSSQNVGIGTTSPSVKLDVVGQINVSAGITFSGALVSGTGIASSGASGDLRLYSNGTQYVTLNTSGYLLVGNTSSYSTSITQVKSTAASTSVYNSWNSATSGTRFHLEFRDGATGISRGNITTDGANTTYATSSDYRLKENVAPLSGALAKIVQLKPSIWTWKENQEEGQGFIAHELAEIIPQAVTGEKDAVDAEGKPVYQGVDTSFLVATLTAAIQELNAKVEAQAAEIANLKAAK